MYTGWLYGWLVSSLFNLQLLIIVPAKVASNQFQNVRFLQGSLCLYLSAPSSDGSGPLFLPVTRLLFFGRNDAKAETPVLWATSCEELTHWKRLWCWEGLGAGGEGDDRGWDGWMASPTRWTWVWVNSLSLVMDREAWSAVIHGVQKSWTCLSDWTELNWREDFMQRWTQYRTETIWV